MKLKVVGIIEVESDEECELAAYTAALLDMLTRIQERKQRSLAEMEVLSVSEALKANFEMIRKESEEREKKADEE